MKKEVILFNEVTAFLDSAVKKGNKELLDWINKELENIGKENFIHKVYEDTLKPAYGDSVSPDNLVIEGGKLN